METKNSEQIIKEALEALAQEKGEEAALEACRLYMDAVGSRLKKEELKEKTQKELKADSILRVEHISKHFSAVKALEDVSMDLIPGEIHALVGGNGAGKSTLVSILSGGSHQDSGEIFLEGNPIRIHTPKEARELGIATIYQTLALGDVLTVTQNLFMGREPLLPPPLKWLGFVNDKKMHEMAKKELDRLCIHIPNLRQQVRYMSGGQRQCIACARALMSGAKVLMMDEPTAALGVKETEQVLSLMEQTRQQGAAVLLISHNMEEVMRLSDRITVLRRGHLVGTFNKNDIDGDTLVGLITGAIIPEGMERYEAEQ